MSILIGLLVGAAIGGALGRVLPIVPLKPKYAPGDKVWLYLRGGEYAAPTTEPAEVVDVSNGAYYVKRRNYGEVRRVTFKQGIGMLALRDEEAA